ncbi:unnamed protein product [Symbiodinium natans]|uniref:Protein-serine/threonine phosphatase n=1 Tax=Symbiodinium natans TaxID=878477 RepID=A0A812NNC4_9DINO|nr:unnamed protein product [Symbiodinium natans]
MSKLTVLTFGYLFISKLTVQISANVHNGSVALYGVFDGHGPAGHRCAAIARGFLPERIFGDPELLVNPPEVRRSVSILSTNHPRVLEGRHRRWYHSGPLRAQRIKEAGGHICLGGGKRARCPVMRKRSKVFAGRITQLQLRRAAGPRAAKQAHSLARWAWPLAVIVASVLSHRRVGKSQGATSDPQVLISARMTPPPSPPLWALCVEGIDDSLDNLLTIDHVDLDMYSLAVVAGAVPFDEAGRANQQKMSVGQVADADFAASQAETDDSLIVALNALALCNRRQAKAAAPQRVAFVPSVRVFRYQEPGKDHVHLRRLMQLLLHARDAAEVRRNLAETDVPDVSVRGETDLRRLSGLIESRFQQSSVGIGELVVVRCMGKEAIGKMVKALAAAWTRCSRVHEGHLSEAGREQSQLQGR